MLSPSQAMLAVIVTFAVAASATAAAVPLGAAAGAPVGAPSSADLLNYAAGFGGIDGGFAQGAGSSSGLGAAEPADLSFADGMSPPDPSKFRTPEELKDYLERLQLYYALVGRPRFGKRSGSGYRRRSWQSDYPEDSSDAEDSGDRIYGYAVFF